MTDAILKEQCVNLDEGTMIERIRELKAKSGKDVLLLAHHYQVQDIVDLADFVGDSLVLSRHAAREKESKFIIFCGVLFMAQSAAILVSDKQKVILPDLSAGCPLADMGDMSLVQNSWNQITGIIPATDIIPITYVNSDIELKAFTGENHGVICTSANSKEVFTWALSQRKKIFFFTDRYLGTNTAHFLGIPSEEIIAWDPVKELGGATPDQIKKAKVIVWNGYCHVHFRFRVEDVLKIKDKYPDAKVVVHPECSEEIVSLSDGVGSTSFIIKFVEQAPKGETIVIGTEINLVKRLADKYPDKKILPIASSICPNMFKISLQDLLFSFDNLGEVNIVQVPESLREQAKIALQRMLDISK